MPLGAVRYLVRRDRSIDQTDYHTSKGNKIAVGAGVDTVGAVDVLNSTLCEKIGGGFFPSLRTVYITPLDLVVPALARILAGFNDAMRCCEERGIVLNIQQAVFSTY